MSALPSSAAVSTSTPTFFIVANHRHPRSSVGRPFIVRIVNRAG
jgi:hypothetical protein